MFWSLRSMTPWLCAGAFSSCSLATAPVALDDDLRALLLVQGSAGYLGHGFLLHQPGAPNLAITAYHVAGAEPAQPLSPAGRLQSPLDEDVAFRLGSRLTIAGARTIGGGGSQHDLAAFQVLDWEASRALTLAETLPAPGDTVFVLSVHVGNEGSVAGRHPARVVIAHDSAFVYEYLASRNPNGTSGAAVLDRSGRVVGTNVGTLVMTAERWQSFRERYAACCVGRTGGEVVGLAVGVRSMKSLLANALTTFRPN